MPNPSPSREANNGRSHGSNLNQTTKYNREDKIWGLGLGVGLDGNAAPTIFAWHHGPAFSLHHLATRLLAARRAYMINADTASHMSFWKVTQLLSLIHLWSFSIFLNANKILKNILDILLLIPHFWSLLLPRHFHQLCFAL